MFFISYKSQEFEQASAVRRTLEDAGMACWMAPDSIEPGSEYGRQITEAVRNCDALVLILSELSQTSMPVLSEVDLAMAFKKTVIPFHLDESELTDAFLFRLGIFQRIEAAHDLDDAYDDLIERAKKVLEEQAQAEQTQTEDSHEPTPEPRRAVARPVAPVRTPASATEEDPQPQAVEPVDKGRLVSSTLTLFLCMAAAYALFVWLSLFDGAYDRWPIYAVVAVALVLDNNFTVSLYRLLDLGEQDATGWQERLLHSPLRPWVLLALTIPIAMISAYTDGTAYTLACNASTTAFLVLLFFDFMELSKATSAEAPKLAKHIGQAKACTVFGLVSGVLAIFFNLEVSNASMNQLLTITFIALCIVAFGGLMALPCNAVIRLVRGLVGKAKSLPGSPSA